EAAAWARQTLDLKWRSVIERALTWRHQHTKDDLTATLDFIRFAIMHAQAVCGETPHQGDRKGRPYYTTDRLGKAVYSRGGSCGRPGLAVALVLRSTWCVACPPP